MWDGVGNCGEMDGFPPEWQTEEVTEGGRGVTYSIICTSNQEEMKTKSVVAAYVGEIGRNAYEWGKEHLAALQEKSKDLLIWFHSFHHHHHREGKTKNTP